MTYEQIAYETDGGVATVTLNRPEQLNAWTGVMHREVKDAMRKATDDEAVRVIVLTGAGRGFCSGADMNTLNAIQDGKPRSSSSGDDAPFDPTADENFQKTYSYFPAVPKPIIAAINGPCAGLGMVLALYCDMRFVSDAAVFTTAFAKRGLIAEHGISWLLPRLVGMAHASDLLYSARKITATEAGAMGLANRVIPHQHFADDVMAYAHELATSASPRSMREMKREVWKAQFQSLGDAVETANEDMKGSFTSEDFKEGVAHYMERRPPQFTGR